ncbi:cobalamin biosynthesis protein [Amphibiibacter pelophylacis]|uniref:Cobalamin biosynthesis protein n=1 Tax=Amphibiibacter pelophylacis TaxID=1799477 RepID=A0ACC6NYS0_9BURK
MNPVWLTAGLGCDRSTPLDTLRTALDQALAQAAAHLGVAVQALRLVALASIQAKSDEVGLLALAQQRGLPLHFYSAAQLAEVAVPNPSATVLRYMGTPSVSEAAALLAAGADASRLVLEKYRWRGPQGLNATVSLARARAPAPVEI